jgi:hypothetical protein
MSSEKLPVAWSVHFEISFLGRLKNGPYQMHNGKGPKCSPVELVRRYKESLNFRVLDFDGTESVDPLGRRRLMDHCDVLIGV